MGAMRVTWKKGALDRVVRVALISGVISLQLSLVGFAAQMMMGDVTSGIHAFYYAGLHPIFSLLPRLSGTYAQSPQHYGELVIILSGLLMMPQAGQLLGRWRKVVLAQAVVALLLTASLAWSGGLVLLAVGVWALRPGNLAVRLVPIFCAAGIVVIVFHVNIGPLYDGPGKAPCHDMDNNHLVMNSRPDPDSQLIECQIVTTEWFGHRSISIYWESKLAALDALAYAPWFGVPEANYDDFAYSKGRLRYGIGPPNNVSIYPDPHSTLFSAMAYLGLSSILCAGLLLLGFWRLRPTQQPHALWPWAISVGLGVIGIDISIHLMRHAWFALGILSAFEARTNGTGWQSTAK